MLPLAVLGGSLVGAALLHAGVHAYRKWQAQKDPTSPTPNTADNPQKNLASSSTASSERSVIIPENLPVDSTSDSRQEAETTNHYLKFSVAGIGLTFLGTFAYAPLLIPGVSVVMYSSIPVFLSAYQALRTRQLKASLVDSIAVVGALGTQYYFASSLASFFYFSAEKLKYKTEDQSKKDIANIFGEQPQKVWVLREGTEIEMPFDQLQVNDIVILHAGEMIPVDGRIVHGDIMVDQHLMTGEAQPIEKTIGDSVFAGTLLMSGTVQVAVERRGSETVAAKIGEILQNTTDFRFSVETKGVQLADKMVPPTLALGGLGLVTMGPVSGVALVSANYSELIRILAPIGVLNFIKLATEQGILIKDGRSLELLKTVDTVVFDKTGTLTIEQPQLGAIHVWQPDHTETDVLRLAAAAEYRQTHPIAKAILDAAHQRQIVLPRIDHAHYEIGYGIRVQLDSQTLSVGSYRYMHLVGAEMSDTVAKVQENSEQCGYSVVYVAVDNVLLGAIELQPQLRPETQAVVKALQQRHLDVIIISGDRETPTHHLAQGLGITRYFAETLPENKAELVRQLQREGRSVCFVGDGINDAIALKTAQVSISLQGASTAATDTAGIILMNRDLGQLPYLLDLAEGLNKNIRNSFATAIVPGVAGVMGVFLFRFGIYSTLILYMASLAAGTANALLPLIQYRKPEHKPTKSDTE